MSGNCQRKNGLPDGMQEPRERKAMLVNFKEWGKKRPSGFVLRDRNHPSIIMWSIGNEVDYPNDPYSHPVLNTEANPQTWAKYSESLPHANRLGEVARELAAVIKTLIRQGL